MESSSIAGSPTGKDQDFDLAMLRPAVVHIIKGADRNSVSAKGVRKELQTLYPFIDIKKHKEECDKLIMEVFESIPAPDAEAEAEDEDDAEEEEEEDVKPKQSTSRDTGSPAPKPKSKVKKEPHQPTDEEVAYRLSLELNGPTKTTRGGGAGQPKSWGRKDNKKKSRATVGSDDDSADESPKKKKKRSGKGGGYNAPLTLSPQLSALCGGYEVLSRPQVVKQVWKHIKREGLQNPRDRREILCDSAMRAVMPATVTMFSMNKYFGAHLSPYEGDEDPVELSD